MISLKWNQLNAWRLSRHHLAPRLKRKDFVKAATRIGGVQAQVMSAAELALWARVDGLSSQDVKSALWKEHTLIKTWAMRGTLHLIPSSDLPLFVSARRMDGDRGWTNYFTYYGISPTQQAAFLEAVPQVLDPNPGDPRTLYHLFVHVRPERVERNETLRAKRDRKKAQS